MIWIIVGITVMVLFILFGIWLIRGGGKIQQEHHARFEKGIKATATIDKIEQPGGRSVAYTTTVLRVSLTVQPPFGQPYSATTGIRIKTADIPRAQPGQTMPVRIAADNPRLVYPDVEWAEMELVTITRAARGK
jgi:hypothetical protein